MKHNEKKNCRAPARVEQVRDKFICFKALFPKVENLPWIFHGSKLPKNALIQVVNCEWQKAYLLA